MRRILMAGALLMAPIAMAQGGVATGAASTGATGAWVIQGDVQGTPVNLTCTLIEAEHKLSGNCSDQLTKTLRTVTGTTSDKGLAWRFDTEYQGSPITVSLQGALSSDGAKINGTMGVQPMGVDGTFFATRAATAAPAAAPAAGAASQSVGAGTAVSMSGVWKVDGDVMGTAIHMMCRLTDAAGKLSGSCAGAQDNYAPHTLTGKVKAQTAEWHFESAFQGNAISVSMTGTISTDGSKVNGDIDVEPMQAAGLFAAVRTAGPEPN